MPKVHMIGNAHLDPVWLWRWQEGYAEVLATFRSALDRMNEFDDFVFTCAGAMYYQWVEETDPKMFEEIRRRIKEGRWVIVGGWMIQPDCNIPCGESFARHSLYGQSYFKKKFGVTAKVGYNVDSFGHTAMLPQILKHSGMDAYVFMRPGPHEMEYNFPENTFIWISPDGTGIPAFRIPDPYCTREVGETENKIRSHKEKIAKTGEDSIMCFYGVGNHGGGPTIENILTVKKLQKEQGGDDIIFSSPNRYFAELDLSGLPEYRGDLHHHACGCYSAAMKVKSLNRISEAHLVNAERAGVMAVLSGVKNSHENLKAAWRPTLFNHFHDIAGGCCIKSGIDDAVSSFGSSIHTADVAQNRALQAIAWNIDTSKGNPVVLDKVDWKLWERDNAGVPIVIFNMNSFDVTAPVKLECCLSSVEDDNGNPVVTQKTKAQQSNGEDCLESEIVANVPAMGWRLYWGYRTKEPICTYAPDNSFNGRHLENEFLSVDISDNDFISRIYDKKNGRELLNGEVKPIVIDETECDTWAHGKFSFTNECGSFKSEGITDFEDGAIRQDTRISYTYKNSEVVFELSLYKNSPELRMSCKVNWQEKHRMLKIIFPTPFKDAKDTVSVPFGFTQRNADGKEQTMQKWVCALENGYGMGIATDTRAAYDLKNGLLRITALRSPAYADHYGIRDTKTEYTDIGVQSFNLVVAPTADSISDIYRLSETVLTPMTAITGTYHKGKLSGTGSILSIGADNVAATAFKPAEDGNGYILRCHETAGKSANADINIPALGISCNVSFAPQEIKTFRISAGTLTETNFLEN